MSCMVPHAPVKITTLKITMFKPFSCDMELQWVCQENNYPILECKQENERAGKTKETRNSWCIFPSYTCITGTIIILSITMGSIQYIPVHTHKAKCLFDDTKKYHRICYYCTVPETLVTFTQTYIAIRRLQCQSSLAACEQIVHEND